MRKALVESWVIWESWVVPGLIKVIYPEQRERGWLFLNRRSSPWRQ